jgi:hypothetical protein
VPASTPTADSANRSASVPLAQATASAVDRGEKPGLRSAELAELAAARRRIAPDDWLVGNRLDTLEIADALATGDRKTAMARLAALRGRAERLGDAIVQAELDSLDVGRPLDAPEEQTAPRIANRGKSIGQ